MYLKIVVFLFFVFSEFMAESGSPPSPAVRVGFPIQKVRPLAEIGAALREVPEGPWATAVKRMGSVVAAAARAVMRVVTVRRYIVVLVILVVGVLSNSGNGRCS